MKRLEGKVAFITGGVRGQGRNRAVHSASEGADVAAAGLRETFDMMDFALATPEDFVMTRYMTHMNLCLDAGSLLRAAAGSPR